MTGKVKKISPRGFAFAETENNESIFIHATACNGEFNRLAVGGVIEFEMEQTEKGKSARNVRLAC